MNTKKLFLAFASVAGYTVVGMLAGALYAKVHLLGHPGEAPDIAELLAGGFSVLGGIMGFAWKLIRVVRGLGT